MLRIYMLEDNFRELSYLEEIVVQTLFNFQPEASLILATSNTDDFLEAIGQESLDDTLFFLDYDLKRHKQTGLDIAKMIRARSITAEIVFISGHDEALLKLVTSEIKPMNFIQKGLDGISLATQIRNDILKSSDQVVARNQNTEFNFIAHQGAGLVSIPIEEIIMIQSSKTAPGILEVFAQHTTLSYRGSLSDIESKYSSLFRCHKSFIINPNAVRWFDPHKRLLTMSNGSHADIGLRKLSKLRKLLEENR
ncbi:LytR/AlgR family response regulator transcription factor [Lacticaseibacillus porcinae]|uniref:LytR/AlgR family response regulator transcription factor n=1 Tax=Lacticaseibacillus porcinae TaxID=1123687 RepID=UPI0013DDAD42|nr:LytTR family DNA-binding domain-containing protein [Lacticaseibacillus porcinae]